MGATLDHTCPACGLSGHVSGGPDCGFASTTTTIYCLTCEELQDSITALEQDGTGQHPLEPRCKKRKSHRVRTWNIEEPCPRCGKARLQVDGDGSVTLWD